MPRVIGKHHYSNRDAASPLKRPTARADIASLSHRQQEKEHDGRENYVYCCNKSETELAVREFLDEPVLGFDAEWKYPCAVTDREKLSMLQIASDRKTVLVHLAQFPSTNDQGEPDEERITGSLLAILTSPDILKVGLNINGFLRQSWMSDSIRDAVRLHKIYHIKMRGLIDLRDLHQSITTLEEHRAIKCSGHRMSDGKLGDFVSLSQLNEFHCGEKPLEKELQKIDWSEPVDNLAREYAAKDARVGLNIYKAIEKKRLTLNPPVAKMTGDEVGKAFGATIKPWPAPLRYRRL